MNHPKKNMCKELRSQQKTKIQMVCKHVKRCEASTITVGMQIKTMWCYLKFIANLRKTFKLEYDLVETFRKEIGKIYQNLKY